MMISRLDHLVITTGNRELLVKFYTKTLGMDLEISADGRKSLRFGTQKINLHKAGEEIKPHAQNPTPGAADLCFITETPVEQLKKHLESLNVEIIAGPVMRNGASGSIISLYIRDPDGNLIELANMSEKDS